jgi:hypothetical protein
MEGMLKLLVVIISFIVRTESAYGRKVNVVGGVNIGLCENRKFIIWEV